jgi:hypothetical protein
MDENLEQGQINGVDYTGKNLSTETKTPAIIYGRVIETGEQLHKVANIYANFREHLKWPK